MDYSCTAVANEIPTNCLKVDRLKEIVTGLVMKRLIYHRETTKSFRHISKQRSAAVSRSTLDGLDDALIFYSLLRRHYHNTLRLYWYTRARWLFLQFFATEYCTRRTA